MTRLRKIGKELINYAERTIIIPLTNHKIRNRVQFVTITNPVTKVPKMLFRKKIIL